MGTLIFFMVILFMPAALSWMVEAWVEPDNKAKRSAMRLRAKDQMRALGARWAYGRDPAGVDWIDPITPELKRRAQIDSAFRGPTYMAMAGEWSDHNPDWDEPPQVTSAEIAERRRVKLAKQRGLIVVGCINCGRTDGLHPADCPVIERQVTAAKAAENPTCWWCGVQPTDRHYLHVMEEAKVRLIFAWPEGDHDHEAVPPSPERLMARGWEAVERLPWWRPEPPVGPGG